MINFKEDNNQVFTVEIVKGQMSLVEKRITQLNKFLTKREVGVVEVKIVDSFTRKEKAPDESGRQIPVDYNVLEVTLPRKIYKINGFTYIASVADKDGSIAVYSLNIEDAHKKYDTDLNFVCSHCHSRRYRTFKAIFEKDNEVFYIGRKCAKEYFGIDIVAALQRIFVFFDLFDELNEEYIVGRSHQYAEVINHVRASIYVCTIDKGFTSRSVAEVNTLASTADCVRILVWPDDSSFSKEFSKEYRVYVSANKEEIEKDVQKVIDFWTNFEPTNDFEFNARNAIVAINNDRVGLIAYATWMVIRDRFELKEEIEKREYNKKTIGSKGDKIKDIEVAIIKAHSYKNSWTDSGMLISFVTEDNYVLTWFTDISNKFCDQFYDGTSIIGNWKGRISFIIKGENEYKDVVSTIIKNVKEVK